MTAALRQALVRLAREKWLSALVVTVLAATLGALCCALAFAYLVALKPLPYPLQERLVIAEQVTFDRGENAYTRDFSYPALAAVNGSIVGVMTSAVMLDQALDVLISHPAQPLVRVQYTSGDYAELFAPPMAMGRFPEASTGVEPGDAVAVISYTTWQTLFGMRSDVLDASIRTASNTDFQIVGVTAQGFAAPELYGPGQPCAVWLPWRFNPSPPQWGWDAPTPSLAFAGRLAPGVDRGQAADRLSVLLNGRWQGEVGGAAGSRAGWSTFVNLSPAQQAIAGSGIDVSLLLLAGTLGLGVLVLVNLTHLFVAKVAERTQEFSVQIALGARNKDLYGRILAHLLVLMLPTAGLAVVVAGAGIALMQHHLWALLPRVAELSVGWWTVAVSLVTAVVLALLLAAIALFTSTCRHPAGVLSTGRRATGSKLSRRLRAALMASQVGVAGLLIALSFGLYRGATEVLNEQGLDLKGSKSTFLYQSVAASVDQGALEDLLARVRERLIETPAIDRVSQSHSPLQAFIRTAVSTESGTQFSVDLKRIDHEYLAITGQRLAVGSNFSAADLQRNPAVALVNGALATLLQRDGGGLGTKLSRGRSDPYTVIGVVDELAHPGAPVDQPRIYLPASTAGSNFIIKFQPGQTMSRERLVALVTGVSPALGVFLFDDLERQRSDALLTRRITAVATAVVALLVMLVAAIGLYGMVRYTTALRRAEIGTRRAFGAQSRHILLMLVMSNLGAFAVGIVSSGVVAIWVLPFLQARFDLNYAASAGWMDTFAAFSALCVLALLACYLSARPLLTQSPASALMDS